MSDRPSWVPRPELPPPTAPAPPGYEYAAQVKAEEESPNLVDPLLIEGFVDHYLNRSYDGAVATPDCHRRWWAWYCDDHPKGALAAPRGHAKTTSITHACTLAEGLFGTASFFLIVSATEELGKQLLGEIKTTLRENEPIREDFAVEILRENETDLIVRGINGMFRVVVKGMEQKLRGLKWRNRRPDRIILDDAEEDEQVESKPRRLKVRNWFQNALMPVGSASCKIRIIGTVLHMDSLLERLLRNPLWNAIREEAHNDDFTEILWPDLWPKERLLSVRSEFSAEGNLDGYNREYRNRPISDETAFFKKDWLTKMKPESVRYFDARASRRFVISTDLAVSTESHADYSVFGTIGVNPDNKLSLLDVLRKRMDSQDIVDKLFELQDDFNPDAYLIEKGVIEKSIGPLLRTEMRRRGKFLNIITVAPTVDKRQRAKGIQKILRAGGMEFNTDSDWWTEFEDEVTRFDKAKYDDQVDMISLVGLLIDKIVAPPDSNQEEEDNYEQMVLDSDPESGRDVVCGY